MSIFILLAVAIALAAFFGFIAKSFRQPLLVGYLFAGIALSILGIFSGSDQAILGSMAQLGIALLLFIVGLELDLGEIKIFGRTSILAGAGQIIFTLFFGYLLSLFLGFSIVSSLYIAIALTFSSTILVVQLLSQKHDLGSLYGRITLGILLVQDLVALFILVFLSGVGSRSIDLPEIGLVALKGIVLVGLFSFFGRFFIPKIFDKIAGISSELLFVSSIAWAFLGAAAVSIPQIGFSPVMGGFLAGLSLASSSERLQISSKIRPLRDFFITLFFLLLGVQMANNISGQLILPAVVLSIFVVFGEILIVMAIMGILGYKSRTSFLTAIALSQISEFSFIIITLGKDSGYISNHVVGLVMLIAVLTMTVSAYLITKGDYLYSRLAPFLSIFERDKTQESALGKKMDLTSHIVLIGADRTGRTLIPNLKKDKYPLLVVDFNPKIVSRLEAEGVAVMYGDISDYELLENLNLGEANLLVSTARNVDDNLLILKFIKKLSKNPITVFYASYPYEALKLYEFGADYVIVPRVVGGEHLANILRTHGLSRDHFRTLREKHFDHLAKERFL